MKRSRPLEAAVPVGAGTDATRVSSYNPCYSLCWLVTGWRSLGGLALTEESGRRDRMEALRLWNVGSASFSRDDGRKGRRASRRAAHPRTRQ